MSKGSGRRPLKVPRKEFDAAWEQIYTDQTFLDAPHFELKNS